MKKTILSILLTVSAHAQTLVNGWTQVPLGRAVYVSEVTGLDTNPGTQALPFKTFVPAMRLINGHKADSLLFKRGETFHILNGGMSIGVSGTVTQPLVFSSYGVGDRPVLLGGGFNITYGGPISHIAIVSLHLQGTPGVVGAVGTGIRNTQGGTDFLVEDCLIEKFGDDIAFDPSAPYTNIRIRRNAIVDATSLKVSDLTQGIYLAKADNVLMEGNYFDHNGYNGPNMDTNSIFNHSVYYHDDSTPNIRFRNNVVVRNADAIQLRAGGSATGNLFYNNSMSLTMRHAGPGSFIDGNVILHATDIDASTPRGFGVYFDLNTQQNLSDSVVISNNLFAFNDSPHSTWGAAVEAANVPWKLTITNNIVWNFGAGILVKNAPRATVTGTDVGPFKDTSRIFTMPVDQYYAAMRAMNKMNWNVGLQAAAQINYIRAGFVK